MKRENGLEQSTHLNCPRGFTECPHCNFYISFGICRQIKYSILKTIKMARFVIGRLKVFKKTYLFIIIIGMVYNTSCKAM